MKGVNLNNMKKVPTRRAKKEKKRKIAKDYIYANLKTFFVCVVKGTRNTAKIKSSNKVVIINV